MVITRQQQQPATTVTATSTNVTVQNNPSNVGTGTGNVGPPSGGLGLVPAAGGGGAGGGGGGAGGGGGGAGGGGGGPPVPPAAAVPNPPVVPAPTLGRILSRFAQDIYLNDKEGSKLFKEATTPREKEDRFGLSLENASTIVSSFRNDAQKFAWGNQVMGVQVDDTGTTANIFEDHEDIELNHLTRQAAETWTGIPLDLSPTAPVIDMKAPIIDNGTVSTAIFQRRIRSKMIAERIIGSLTKPAIKQLEAHKASYQWTDANKNKMDDGPTMLYIILRMVKPNVKIGVETYKEIIENISATKYGNDVAEMIATLRTNYDKILEKEETYSEYPRRVFKAMESVNNEDFALTVKLEKQEWTKATKANPYDINKFLSIALDTYNNLVAEKAWTTTLSKNDKIVALTTKVQDLETRLASANLPAGGTDSSKSNGTDTSDGKKNGSRNGNDNTFLPIAEWRKKRGDKDTIERDGRTWYFCPHHKNAKNGYPDGLYVTHTLSQCRVAKKLKRDKQNEGGNSQEGSSSLNDSNGNLSISNKLKAVLMTRHAMSADEVDAILSEATQGN